MTATRTRARGAGRPTHADVAARMLALDTTQAQRPVDGAAPPAREGGRMRCPRCANPMYDPAEPDIAAECAWCGHVEYGPPRGAYRGRSA